MTTIILVLTALISFSAFQNQQLKAKLMFNASLVKHSKEWYRVFTHAFIHGDWLHLLANCYVLWMFGGQVEIYFEIFKGTLAPLYFLSLYIGGILCSTLPAYMRHQDNFYYNSLGASGAVSAVLFVSIYFNPMASWGLILIPGIQFPAIFFGLAYLLFEWYMDKKKSSDNIAHDAHFWGAAFGIVFALVMFPAQFSRFINNISTAILG
jgi:membrane associated rhomboid family serine protease